MGLVQRAFPIQRLSLATKYACDAIGDSLTFNVDYLTAAQYYPQLLNTALQALGCSTVFINSGVSGDTSAQVLVRSRSLPTVQTGTIGVIFVGTNDLNHQSTVQASPSPSSTVFAVGAGVGAFMLANTNILVNGVSRVVQSVSTDTITLASALPGAPTAGQAVVIDTAQNIIDTATVMSGVGYTRQLIGTMVYLNWSSGGDTLQAQQTLASQTRVAQNAAATALGAPTADFYTYMRNLIVNGTVVQGSFTWHVADMNPHTNAYGQSLQCDCILAAINAQGWLAGLRT